MRGKIRITVSKSMYIYFAVMLLLVPLRWILALVISAALHEVFHLIVIRTMGIGVQSLRIGISGAEIETELMNPRQELLCALAGPACGFCLLPVAKWMPEISLCAIFQSLYNLIPVYPADGGRALRCGMGLLMPEMKADRVCRVIEVLVLGGFLLTGIYGTFCLGLGYLPLAFACVIVWGSRKKK